MNYWFTVLVFFSCLVLTVLHAKEDDIPLEAIKIPYKERRSKPLLARRTVPEFNAHFDSVVESDFVQHSPSLAIYPFAGATRYLGDWDQHVSNQGSFGVGLEYPLYSWFSVEGQLGHGLFQFTHSGTIKNFTQTWLGTSGKVSLRMNRWFAPYLGAGLELVDFENLNTLNGRQNRWVGQAVAIAGVDLRVAEGIALGGRVSLSRTIVNGPTTGISNGYSLPDYADSNLVRTDFFRFLGIVRVDL